MKCCVTSCKSYSHIPEKRNNISFHAFPVDDDLKEKWIEIINQKDWSPKKYSRICSLHFEDSDFLITSKGYRKLRYGACPQSHLIIQYKDPMTPQSGDTNESQSDLETANANTLREEIGRLKQRQRKDSIKIRRLQTKVRRLREKVRAMKTVILSIDT